MSSATQPEFAQDAWQSPRNARTLRAYMALRNQEIAARIRDLRKLKGNPPQARVSEALSVGPRTYQTWESGEAKPSYRNLQKIAEYYGVSEGYVLEGLDDRPVVEGVPEQIDGGFDEFRSYVTTMLGEMREIKQALRDASVKRVEFVDKILALLEQHTQLLARQSNLIESLQSAADRLPDGPTLQDHLVQEMRDTLAQTTPPPEN